MGVRVYIPTPYREFTGGRSRVEADAGSVAELLERLSDRYPRLRGEILAADGTLREHLNLYVNEVEVRSLEGPGTPLNEGDEVALIPAMAGGREDGPVLTDNQLGRYSRHILLEEVGLEGQRRLLEAKVLLVGAGGLGSPAAIYAAAAGIGTLGIVDGDRVDLSNLQRQILHFTHDVGRPKTQSARRHLEDINPDVRVVTYQTVLGAENAMEIIEPYDLVINGCDNFPTRYLVNDACVLLGKPLVDASILRFEGQASVYLPGRGCYRCLFPAPPPPGSVPSCAEAGVIGALAGHLGTLQVVEAVKVLLGIGETLHNRLLIYDALTTEYRTFRWDRNPDCPVCGEAPTIKELIDYHEFCGVPHHDAGEEDLVLPTRQEVAGGTANGREAAAPAAQRAAIDLAKLAAREEAEVTAAEAADLLAWEEIQLVDVREESEWQALRIDGALHIPMAELAERAAEVDDSRPAIFLCAVGARSAQAVDAFRRAGYTRTYNLKGGIFAWMNERLPVTRGAE